MGLLNYLKLLYTPTNSTLYSIIFIILVILEVKRNIFIPEFFYKECYTIVFNIYFKLFIINYLNIKVI